jgi:2-desacetyl-2-hydroxyethyl bacteriochlorophyllide A dehydrogenase
MVLRAFGEPLALAELPAPRAGPDEVVVRVMACGVDGTDLKLLDGFGYRPELPFVMGHEPAGVVAEVGERVADVRLGDRVVPYLFFYCGACRLCLSFREQICPRMAGVLGVRGHPGGYAEQYVVPARQLVRLPEGVGWPDAATCSDAGVTALHAVDRAGVRLGETVVVFGSGGVGLMVVQIAKLAGARVLAVVRSDRRGERAREMGADEVVDSRRGDVAAQVRALTDGWGADRALDCVGSRETIGDAFDALRGGGRLVVVGYTPDEYPLSGRRLAQNEIEVIGTRCGRRQDLVDTVRLMGEGKLRSVVTDAFPLEQANEALEHLRSGRALGRVVLVPD